MNKTFTKAFYAVAVIVFFLTAALPASAQIPFKNTVLESGGLYSALTKDASNNIYAIRVRYGTSGMVGDVIKYVGATSTVIYTGLHEGNDTGPGGDLPWGLVVTSNGDVYVSTDFSAYNGAIVKLKLSGGTYTASNFQTGAYYTALAVDGADNIYATQYDGVGHYAIYKYAANSANGTAGTKLYGKLKQGVGYSYPTGLAVASNGDIFVTDAFAQDASLPVDGGHVYKLTAASSYGTAVAVSTGHYATALALDAAGNLYTSENTGTNTSGYKLLKYTNGGGTPAVAFTPLHTNGIYYPYGIAPISNIKVFAIDGDDGTTGGSIDNLASSNVATLAVLKFTTAATFTLVSGSDYRDYTTTVPYPTSSVQVVATASDATASIKVNGVTVASGVASAAIPLNVGTNVINVVVTAQDGITVKTYGITATRTAPSTNAILSSLKTTPTTTATLVSGPDYRDYTASVANATSSITVTAVTQDANAQVKINGVAVASGVASAPIPLVVGDGNIITIVSTAEDGVTQKTYAYKITRAKPDNAILSGLSTTPTVTFTTVAGPDYRDYTGYVSNATASVTVKATAQDPLATIKINGQTVASGVSSSSIPLIVGSNTIATVVTAQDGTTTKTYSMNITRQYPGGIALNAADQGSQIAGTDVVVRQNLSPNGDGNGDVLVIDGIAAHPDNKFQVMTRNGTLVYEAKGYDNATKVFDGHSSISGKLQDVGTYMYSLEYKDGAEVKHKTGFIVLKY